MSRRDLKVVEGSSGGRDMDAVGGCARQTSACTAHTSVVRVLTFFGKCKETILCIHAFFCVRS